MDSEPKVQCTHHQLNYEYESSQTLKHSPNDPYEKMVVENVLDISYAHNPRILHGTPLRV